MDNHGTRSEYQRGCRCDQCRAANATYDRELRARAGLPEHGTRYCYKKGCRCDDCRAAQTAYSRQWRRARGGVPRLPKAEIRYRLGEIEHLIAGGVYPPEACQRVGWSVQTAERYAALHGYDRVMSSLAMAVA